MTMHACSRNQRQRKIIQEKIRKKDNQERLAKEELDSRDKHHKIKTGILRQRNNSLYFKILFLYVTCVNPTCIHAFPVIRNY